MMSLARAILCLVAAALLFFGAPAASAKGRDAEIAATVDRLSAIEAQVLRGETLRAAPALRAVIAEARRELVPLAEEIQRTESEVKALGAAPKEGDPPEPEGLAAERAALNAALSALRAQRTRLSAAIEQANMLLSQVSRRRIETFYASLGVQEAPLVSPLLWTEAAVDFRRTAQSASLDFVGWRAARSADDGFMLSVALVVAATILSLLLFGPAVRGARHAFINPLQKREPTRRRRLAVAGAQLLSRVAPGLVAGLAVIGTARATGLLPAAAAPIAEAVWLSLIAWLVAQGFLGGLITPAAPAWRLSDVRKERAKAISALLLAIVAVFGVSRIVIAAVTPSVAPALVGATKGVGAALIGALMIALSLRQHWRPDAGDLRSDDKWALVRRSVRLVGVALIAASFAGYVRAADFAASRIYYGALVAAILWAARASLSEAASLLDANLRQRASGEGTDTDRRASMYWVGLAIDIILILVLIPVTLGLAGWTFGGIRDFSLRAFSGIRIGGAVISIGDILAALAAFVGLLAVTRLLQGALQRGPLAHSRIDRGVQDSLITLMGYAGLFVALVSGISILGVDLSSLALIAGALSVGVGLGLQGVVNNFVSGLILLFERPIKVGDWIVTQSGQGIVKKISVRSTEIETFEKSSIIVPNSELITSAVTNYTHRNSLGRVTVAVNVSYSADPQRVYEILLNCARRIPLFLIEPGPFVTWKNFGLTALEFEVSGFLADISKGLEARNQLRFSIFEAFQKEGVPFPRQDVHLPVDAAARPTA